jgi:hypothetical protein
MENKRKLWAMKGKQKENNPKNQNVKKSKL